MNSHLKTFVGFALSVLLLAWVLRDVSPGEVARELRDANLPLLVLAVGITMGGFAIRALRWGILLRPLALRIPFRPRFAAVMIGFAANNVLPARVGEIARALTLTRITPVGMAASVATLLIERILDGLALVALLFLAMNAPGFPDIPLVGGLDPRAAVHLVGSLMAAGGVGLLLLVIAPKRSVAVVDWMASRVLPRRFRGAVVTTMESFLSGLAVLRSVPLFVASALLAVGQWLFTAVSFVVAFRAFGIDLVPFSGAVFLQSVISLAVALPSSPGFFGPFEAAARVGLSLWGVAADKAVSFAVGFHIGGFIPVTVIGIYYVWRLNLRWREMGGGAERSAMDSAPPPEGRMHPSGFATEEAVVESESGQDARAARTERGDTEEES